MVAALLELLIFLERIKIVLMVPHLISRGDTDGLVVEIRFNNFLLGRVLPFLFPSIIVLGIMVHGESEGACCKSRPWGKMRQKLPGVCKFCDNLCNTVGYFHC